MPEEHQLSSLAKHKSRIYSLSQVVQEVFNKKVNIILIQYKTLTHFKVEFVMTFAQQSSINGPPPPTNVMPKACNVALMTFDNLQGPQKESFFEFVLDNYVSYHLLTQINFLEFFQICEKTQKQQKPWGCHFKDVLSSPTTPYIYKHRKIMSIIESKGYLQGVPYQATQSCKGLASWNNCNATSCQREGHMY